MHDHTRIKYRAGAALLIGWSQASNNQRKMAQSGWPLQFPCFASVIGLVRRTAGFLVRRIGRDQAVSSNPAEHHHWQPPVFSTLTFHHHHHHHANPIQILDTTRLVAACFYSIKNPPLCRRSPTAETTTKVTAGPGGVQTLESPRRTEPTAQTQKHFVASAVGEHQACCDSSRVFIE